MAPTTSVIHSTKHGNLINMMYLSFELAVSVRRNKSSSHRGNHGRDVIEIT